ncbi:hypothetical protein AB0K43_09425 [Kitasatospora sp. NPDC049258]|uniref:hypothetical protein n=1 Tax=Kitasatospora sp. NPDC049258 TaxID=3155394 RepID=UPI003428BE89
MSIPNAPHRTGHGWLAPVLAPHLYAGEQVLIALQCDLDDLLPLQVPRAHRRRRPGGPDTESWLGAAFEQLLPAWLNPFAVGWHGPAFGRRSYRAVRRAFHGGSWSGGWSGTAGGLLAAVRNSARLRPVRWDDDNLVLAVTGHRLLLLTDASTPSRPQPEELLAAVPRGGFHRRREPHPARQTRRVDLAFADGSWLALRMERPEDVAALRAALD